MKKVAKMFFRGVGSVFFPIKFIFDAFFEFILGLLVCIFFLVALSLKAILESFAVLTEWMNSDD